MNRSLTGTVLWTCLAGLLGATLFFVKHEVKDLETRLASVNHEIARNEEDIHVLNAEWSFLNDPVRLRDLAERHLGMRQMGPTQMTTLDTLNSVPSTVFAQARPQVPNVKQDHTAPVTVAQATPAQQPRPVARPHIAGGTGLAMASSPGETR